MKHHICLEKTKLAWEGFHIGGVRWKSDEVKNRGKEGGERDGQYLEDDT